MTPLHAPLVRPRAYVLVWLGLLALLALNYGLAQLNLGPFNIAAALAIAFVQMLLALLYFMHIRFSTALTRMFVAAGFIWLLVLFDLTLSDYLSRGSVPGRHEQSWQHGAWPVNPPANRPQP